MRKDIALLVGGWSVERDVSLDKGKAVAKTLRAAGYDLRVVDVTRDLQKFINDLTPKPDVVFNNLYGRGGEDGVIQGVLETLEIPYTHSGVTASATGMDKPLAKRIAESVGVRTPKSKLVTKQDLLKGHPINLPYVVKPPSEGSSFGVYIVTNENQNAQFVDDLSDSQEFLVEEYIPGRELTVAVLDRKPQAVTEIVSKMDFFDYEAKYKDTQTQYILPAKISEEVYEAALESARLVYNEIGCAGLARCDFRYDDTKSGAEGLYFLEINTQPGFTAQSIGPSQVIYNGMSFQDLCIHLIETAKLHGNPAWQEEKEDSTENKTEINGEQGGTVSSINGPLKMSG